MAPAQLSRAARRLHTLTYTGAVNVVSVAAHMTALIEDLRFRGLFHQSTGDPEGHALERHLSEAPRRVYAGFDPTSASLTVGHLVQIQLLRRFQLAGHVPVVVVGGGTARVGDPSGKESERPVLALDQIRDNVQGITRIMQSLLCFEGDNAAVVVNNLDWLESLSFLGMLRDVGKHFSVNMMIQKDSVRERLHHREQGISYTEFSYLILQAYDFLHLNARQGVSVQLGGSDQWGNIVAGVELIRRVEQREAFGLTVPLLTKSDGGKFGKTESGAVWLTTDRTSPYAFYQFWLNAADADVVTMLKRLTLLPRAEIETLEAEHAAAPERRRAQSELAATMTALVHGDVALAQAQAASKALFSGEVSGLDAETLGQVFEDAPSSEHARGDLERDGLELVTLLVSAGVCKSRREARQLIATGAISVNGVRLQAERRLTVADLLHDSVVLIRRGRRNWHLTRWS